jgi:hypothetical protein
MSSKARGLLSGTFFESGSTHVVELVHQRDEAAQRRLLALAIELFAADGRPLGARDVDPGQETLDLAALVQATGGAPERVMVLLDARYDEAVFPYRPHHYGFVHRAGSEAPPLYYAVNAALGGVPDRIGATGINNFETYLFRRRAGADRFSVLAGNPARFASVEVQVTAFYGAARAPASVVLPPRAHAEVPLPPGPDGAPPTRVEVKALARLVSYVVGRRPSGDLVLFDHMFTYFR